MPIRFFDWRDLGDLHNLRNDITYLYNELYLTAGTLRIFNTLVTSLVPVSGTFTLVSNSSAVPIYGQVVHHMGDEHAYISFLAPASQLNNAPEQTTCFFNLMENLIKIAGERGALRILADVEEDSPAFSLMHQLGYVVYSRQRVWRIPDSNVNNSVEKTALDQHWRRARQEDWIAIQSLYNNLVPGLVQKGAPALCEKPRGLVCYQDSELTGYIEIHYGINGLYAWPFIHPNAYQLSYHLVTILRELPGLPSRISRPVYACVSQYQSWLENDLEANGAEAGPLQVLLVKHLTNLQILSPAFALSSMEKGQAKPLVLSTTGENYETNSHH